MNSKNISNRRQQNLSRSRELIKKAYYDKGYLSPYARYQEKIASVLKREHCVLDVGCGRTFPMAALLGQATANIHGIDPEADLEDAGNNGPATIKKGSVYAIPYPDQYFDVVISQSVLEHLDNPLLAFREIARVLKPGGGFIFLAPSKYDYVSVAARLLPTRFHQKIVKAIEGREESDTFPTFYRANSRRALKRLAQQANFSATQLEYLSQTPYGVKFSPLLCRLVIAYDFMITRVARLNFLRGWIFGHLTKSK